MNIAEWLVRMETEKFHTDVNQELRKHGVKKTEHDRIKDDYFAKLKELLLEHYSLGTATPRLRIELSNYFQYIESFCLLFESTDLEPIHYRQLKTMLLSQFHNSELKMICYYFYLFYDVVNSIDTNITTRNPVKEVGLFEGSLRFADDFSRNYDPRNNEFIKQVDAFRGEVGSLRTKTEKLKKKQLPNGS
jgi:hypothetical protein